MKVVDFFHGNIYGFKPKSKINEKFFSRLNYDNFFGKLINRFLVQSILESKIFIHGNENKKIGIISLDDTLNAFDIILRNIPFKDKYYNVNVFSEVTTIKNITQMIEKTANVIGLDVEVNRFERNEHEDYFNPSNKNITGLGFKPTLFKNNVKTIMKELKNYNKLRCGA